MMAPRDTMIMGDKTPSPGRPSMRKAASHEPLGSPVPLSGGGVSLASHYASARASPTPTPHRNQRKTASDDGTPKSTNSSALLIGSSGEDDVLTEASSEAPAEASSTDNDTQLQVVDTPRVMVDAQGIYPGTACMFVANLSQPHGDSDLLFAVTKAFSRYGKVWVKIKRDATQMPYAFCQFTNDQDAKKAHRLGNGLKILGRPCRAEMARSGTTFLVSKRDSTYITIVEAIQLLNELGVIAKAEYFHEPEPRLPGTPLRVFVKYRMYDARRETMRHFATNPTYIVVPWNPSRRNNTQSSVARRDGSNALLERYDKDRRSAYVGSLPSDMTEDVLRTLASSSGTVMSVQLYKRSVPGNPGQINCFAFVEFARPDGADDLITTMNGTEIDGKYIRVERKHSRTFEAPRHEARNQNTWSTAPRRVASTYTAPRAASSEDDSTPRVERKEYNNRTMPYNNKSYSYGQGRRPRQTIFNANTSVGKALSDLNRGRATERVGSSQDLRRSEQGHKSQTSTSPSKKSVEFALPSDTRSGTSPSTPTETAVDGGQHVAAPNVSDVSSGAAVTAVNAAQNNGYPAAAGVMMHNPYAWPPYYPPYPQGYPYMAGPVAPQAAGNEFMFPSYMAQQYPPYPSMYHYNMMPPAHLARPAVAPAGQHLALGQGNGGLQETNGHTSAQ